MGIIGILASIVIIAINPSKQLCEARNAKRSVYEREIRSALNQYAISNANYPVNILRGEENATEICSYNAADTTSCLDFDDLVDQNFISALEQDGSESNVNYLGYTAYEAPGGQVIISAKYKVAYGYGSGC